MPDWKRRIWLGPLPVWVGPKKAEVSEVWFVLLELVLQWGVKYGGWGVK
jgi:hypothetical protein